MLQQGDHLEQGLAVQVGSEERLGPGGQVDRIVPIGKAQQRQAVLPGIAVREGQAALQMLQHRAGFQRLPVLILVVEGDHLIQEGEIAAFLSGKPPPPG